MTATAKKQKPLKRHPSKLKKMSAYMILTLILISIMAVLFAFPLYWIITGSFKTGAAINSTTPEWWPSQWVLTNYQKLFRRQERTPVAAGGSVQRLVQRGRRTHLFLHRPYGPGSPALDDQHGVHGCHVHDPHLHHRSNGRLCAGQKALRRP